MGASENKRLAVRHGQVPDSHPVTASRVASPSPLSPLLLLPFLLLHLRLVARSQSSQFSFNSCLGFASSLSLLLPLLWAFASPDLNLFSALLIVDFSSVPRPRSVP